MYKGAVAIQSMDVGSLLGGDWKQKEPWMTNSQGRIIFRNCSNKVIKYVFFEAYLINRVGDIYDDSWGRNDAARFTGPLQPGEIGIAYTRDKIDSHQEAADVYLKEITIEYMDGSSETIDVEAEMQKAEAVEREAREKALTAKNEALASLDVKYAELRKKIEPALPAMMRFAAQFTLDNFAQCRVMSWNGDPSIIRDGFLPILFAVWRGEDMDEAPKGELLSARTKQIFILTENDFILYDNGERHSWPISAVSDVVYKAGMLDEYLVVSTVVSEDKFAVDPVIEKYIPALKLAIMSLKDALRAYEKAEEAMREIPRLCEGYEKKSLKELRELKNKLERYGVELADEYIAKVDAAILGKVDENNSILKALLDETDRMSLTDIKEAKKTIKEFSKADCSQELVNEVLERLTARADVLYAEKWDPVMANMEQMDLTAVESRINELILDNMSASIKKSYQDTLMARRRALYEVLIQKDMENYLELSVPELQKLSNRLYEYPKEISASAIQQLTSRIYDLHKAEIDELNADLESKSIEEIKDLKKRITQADYESSLKENAFKLYDSQIKKLYSQQFEEIISRASNCDFSEAYGMCNPILTSDAPEDIRTKYTALVQILMKKLYRAKYEAAYAFANNIVVQRGLQDATFMSANNDDAGQRELLTKIGDRIRNTYSAYPYWEEPLAAHLAEKLLSDSGYALTPEHFYVFGGAEEVYGLQDIAAFAVQKKLIGSDIVMRTKTGIDVPLKTKHGNSIEMISDVLNQILSKTCEGPAINSGSQSRPVVSEPVVTPVQETVAGTITDEYAMLRPMVEPFLSVLKTQAENTKGEYENSRIMCWTGDPSVIAEEGTPIYASIFNFRCTPKMYGDKFIDEKKSMLITDDTEFFYLLTANKFILYVKRARYEWNIRNIAMIEYKVKLLTNELRVVEKNGVEKVIKISVMFQKHVAGLNEMIRKIQENVSV